MAKCYLTCLFLFYTVISKTSFISCTNDYYLYKTENAHHIVEYSSNLELSNAFHTYRKREAFNPTETSNISSSVELTTSNETAILLPKKKGRKIEKSPAAYLINQTISLQDNFSRNLGENGTGIRKNVTEAVSMPPLVHDMSQGIDVADGKNNTDELRINIPSDIDTEEGGKLFNETLKHHNITNSRTDTKLYYISTVSNDTKTGQFYWVNLTNKTGVKVNELLSQSHRRAATIKLSFDFPFYGHLIKNVTIATGGFLYTGDYVHPWLAATQYIAPLMANFDTSLSNDSYIKHFDNGSAFTVEWEKAALQDKPDGGEFTFQTTLFKNGDIVFVYKEIPLLVDQIQELHHPVKVGLSDAYIMDQIVFLVRKKTIYEYDKVHLNKTDIRNWTSIYLKALPTCLDSHNCVSCLTRKIQFKCQWCPIVNRCSSEGFDRLRQDWVAQGCPKKSLSNVSMCTPNHHADIVFNESSYENYDSGEDVPHSGNVILSRRQKQDNFGVSEILAILFLIAMLCGLSMWIFYAYRNPHTTSGQILIRYRPSQWSWRRGEARYTAATIHI